MSQLNIPLNNDELDQLDNFLIDRIPEDEVEGVVDEGILDISELDGFLTAIISGPLAINPSEWLPVVWGAYEPQWASSEESEAIVALILRHMNTIVNVLNDSPEDFEPIILAREEGGETITVVDEWCTGYMKGIGLSAQAWREGGEAVAELLFPITLFSSEAGRKRLETLETEEVEVLKRSIPMAVQKLHAFWLSNRGRAVARQTFMHDKAPVGRNDPCPCGSGKKFKKCCLH